MNASRVSSWATVVAISRKGMLERSNSVVIGGDDGEGFRFGALFHLGAVARARTADAGAIAGERECDGHAQHLAPLHLAEPALGLPALAQRGVDGFRRLDPILPPPVDVGTNRRRLGTAVALQPGQRFIDAIEARQGARLQQPPLLYQLLGQRVPFGGRQGLDRLLGPIAEKVDDGELGADARLLGAA